MNIRQAEKKDLDGLVKLLVPFYYESEVWKNNGMKLCLKSIRSTFTRLIEGAGVILVADNGNLMGALGGVVSPSWMDYSQKTVQEVFYFVDKKYRGSSAAVRLLSAFAAWAKKLGAISVEMISLPNSERSKIERLYERKGFRPSELFYVRRL